MKASIVMTRENVGNIAEWMARHMHVYGRVKSAEEILTAMDAVTADDLVRVANQYLLAAPMTLTALGQVAGGGLDMGALPEVA
jgi:predicted Zn-dependent peptidase